MARLKSGTIPSLRLHKPSGRAVVSLSGQDFYCGTWGSKAAIAEYDRQVAAWIARGRVPLPRVQPPPVDEPAAFTVAELILAFKRHAEIYYRKSGRVTNEVTTILRACKVLRACHGRLAAADFGPRKLKEVRQAMIDLGWTRKQINKQIERLVRMFAWGVEEELLPAGVAQGLREVEGLKKGRSAALESAPILPVDDGTIEATLPHLPPIVAAMVRLQRLTGCRPEEVCMIRPCDVDRSEPVWAYRPESHKTEHHGRDRVVFIGPRGQEILEPYLARPSQAFCFCPTEAEAQRRELATRKRTTPLNRGNRPGTNRTAAPKRRPGGRYTTHSYGRAIKRACDLAFAMPAELRKGPKGESAEQKAHRRTLARQWRKEHAWAPNRLRHTAATEIRRRYGIEASQVIAGHATANVTQVYAERDLAKASAVMAEVG